MNGNYTETLNLADTLLIQCKAYGKAKGVAQDANKMSAFAIVTNGMPTKISTTVPTTAGTSPQLSVDAGTLVFDSINGNAALFPHFLIDISTPTVVSTDYSSSAILSIFVPQIGALDSATYYCVYADGSADSSVTTNAVVAVSSPFILNVRTVRGNKAGGSVRNRNMEYSLALMSVSKIIF